ncbi:hypothetical protein [Syntrophomonas curvata]
MKESKRNENKGTDISKLLFIISEDAFRIRTGAHDILKDSHGEVGAKEAVIVEDMIKHMESISARLPAMKEVAVSLPKR